MKVLINKIFDLSQKMTLAVSKKDYKNITEDDTDKLAEAIELLNDAHEELYDKVFDESNSFEE